LSQGSAIEGDTGFRDRARSVPGTQLGARGILLS
jgi:hypothetical protein